MNYKDQCRTCLTRSKEMRHIHTVISIAGDDVRLSDILQNFYDFKVTGDVYMPENICIYCVHQLTITYSFKILIESSTKKLSETKLLNCVSENNYYSCDSDDQKPIKELKMQCFKRKLSKRVQNNTSATYEKKLYCVECKAEFDCGKSLNEHCLSNHPVKNIMGRECDYCNEKFEDFRSFVIHRKLHLKPYLCENCWEGFVNINELHSHSCHPKVGNKDRNKSERVLRQCDQCGKSYPPGYIRIHILTHSNNRPYCCKFCPKRFKVPGGLNSHVLWNHKRTRNHKCEVCNATFISSSSRSSHIRKSHLKEKKYGCESCEKRFFSKSELQRHSLTHTGVKNFHCHLCDKSYQTRYGLNVHLKSHSQISTNVINL